MWENESSGAKAEGERSAETGGLKEGRVEWWLSGYTLKEEREKFQPDYVRSKEREESMIVPTFRAVLDGESRSFLGLFFGFVLFSLFLFRKKSRLLNYVGSGMPITLHSVAVEWARGM
jgi:hypothetical protein